MERKRLDIDKKLITRAKKKMAKDLKQEGHFISGSKAVEYILKLVL